MVSKLVGIGLWDGEETSRGETRPSNQAVWGVGRDGVEQGERS